MNSRALSIGCLLAVAIVVALAANWPRQLMRSAVELPQEQGWAVSDPDSLYHLRRIQLWSEGGDVGDGYDEWLNHPDGANVPWPPYYTVIARTLIGPGAPEGGEELRRWIEHRAAHLPLLFAIGTALLTALATWWILTGLAKPKNADGIPILPLFAALGAGLAYAFTGGSIFYSVVGNADHHAFVTFANAAMLVVLLHAVRREFSSATAARWGAMAGVFAGLMIGAWVGSLMYIICLQLVLAAMMLRHSRNPLPGLPAFGLWFHLVAAAVLMPAVWSSPWLVQNPWMVVNLSWFHPLFLLIGAAVFIPLKRMPADPAQATFRRYPFMVAAALAGLAILLAIIPNAIGSGIRQGFDWLSTTEEFMTNVAESRPLIGEGAEEGVLVQYLGYGLHLLPLAWLAAAWMWWRQRANSRAPLLEAFLIVVPILALQAANQRRFADALAMPLAVMLAVAIAGALQGLSGRLSAQAKTTFTRFAVPSISGVLVLVVMLAVQWPTVALAQQIKDGPQPGQKRIAKLAAPQMLYQWLRQQPSNGDDGVLTNWGQGHAITWAAQKPSVACNFGSYVGKDSFQSPSRFFLSNQLADAEQLLRKRKVRWVIVPWQLPGMLRHQTAALADRPYSDYYNEQFGFTDLWFQTLGARLMFNGQDMRWAQARPVDFLRLVHVSPTRMQKSNLGGVERRVPAGWIWQRVEGAVLEAKAEPGQVLKVSLQIQYPNQAQPLQWTNRATVNADGQVSLRVPYATIQNNGDGQPLGKLTWQLANQSGALDIPESAVWSGEKILLPTSR